MESNRLLTVAECAEHLHVCTSTIRKWIARGILPVIRVAHTVRIAPADLERLAQSGR